MLYIAHSLRELSFEKLMQVYYEGNLENGKEMAPDESEARQAAIGEQSFYQYLKDCFFKTDGAEYAIWTESGRYFSALRLEPYKDGLLLEALETLPDVRRQGYAFRLMSAVLNMLSQRGGCKVYSHVSKRNSASLNVHRKCGFSIISDYASYIDGSVSYRAYTLLIEK